MAAMTVTLSSMVSAFPASNIQNLNVPECCHNSTWTLRSTGLKSAVGSITLWTRPPAESLILSRRRYSRRGGLTVISPWAKVATSEGAVGISKVDESDIQGGLENSDKLSEKMENTPNVPGGRTIRLLIAGGGIGGLVLALAAKNQGVDVKVFERDLSTVRGEGQYRGPIQIQSNALAALEAIDGGVAEQILDIGCVTGDRINGLVDGLTGSWYCKFDTFTPAVERGIPITRVISRMTLQSLLARAVGPEIIQNSCNVVDYEDDGSKVTVILEDGRRIEGDILIGADGIRSKVRNKLLGPSEATYSDYTCYTGIADFVPADIETVGYRVFLGNKQYFVSSDVGNGKMQWYAFYNEPAGGVDRPGGRKERLLEIFGEWCDGVVDLLLATPEEHILRRDIYDRIPILTWSKGRVTLLGDAAHAMQPNLGQGGCMAIEDSYQLALDLAKAMDKIKQNRAVDLEEVLKSYESKRRLRVGAIHGMARMAAIMASTYKAYLGEGLGPLEVIRQFRIPHPGRVAGQFFVLMGMPLMLGWVLGGNMDALPERIPSCRIDDKANKNMKRWFWDDDALERATIADWYLVPAGERMLAGDLETSRKMVLRIGGVNDSRPTIIGSVPCEDANTVSAVISSEQVAARHARVHSEDGAFFLTDLYSKSGTWITNIGGGRYKLPPSIPVRIRQGDKIEFGLDKQGVFRVKLRKPQPSAARASAPALTV
ncbi:unnamed protein product [Calypogeia fissa]